MTGDLNALENRTIYILREAYARIDPLVMLWSMGKDSTALLWMVRKAFYGRIPFPVILLDTGDEMDAVYAFRDEIARGWSVSVVNEPCPPESAVDQTLPPATRAAMRKAAALNALVARDGVRGVIAGIRHDEQALRAKERFFSPRADRGEWRVQAQPPEFWDFCAPSLLRGGHVRVHPLLHWTEIDIWRYTQRENIPCVPLYFSRDGMRYRSLGEKSITRPVPSDAGDIDAIIRELELTRVAERSGRVMDRESEDSFERLRLAGYL